MLEPTSSTPRDLTFLHDLINNCMSNNIYSSIYNFYLVYKTTNLINSKIYIGCHATNDLEDGYIGSGKLLKKAVKKYGKENFKFEILHFFNNPTDMFECERRLVTIDLVESDESYNLVVGGSGGFKVLNVDEWKSKLKESRKGKKPALGLRHSEETRKRISEKGKGKTPWNKGMPGTWIGKTHSEDSKRLISENRKGKATGEKNPMFGKSAVAGRKWYNDGEKCYYLFPTDPLTAGLFTGRLMKRASKILP